MAITDSEPAKSGRVFVLNEVSLDQSRTETWKLCLQRARYVYDNGEIDEGYRFIWRRPNGNLQGARGQARIPSLKIARLLMAAAEKEGWGQFEADDTGHFTTK